MQRVVIDPPKQDGRFLYQEECCYNLCPDWQVPALSLRIATSVDAAYIPPLENWDQFAAAVEKYADVWMIYTFPLSARLKTPDRVRGKITAVANPHKCSSNLDGQGFKATTSTIDYGLKIDERFWYLYEGNSATIQIASGCVYRCQYCVWSRAAFPRHRWADPVISAELTNRAKNPYLICPQITGDRQWLESFVGHLRSPVGEFSTDLNCAHLPAFIEDISTLAAHGMSRAIVGIEALSESALRRMRCPHTISQARTMFGLLAKLGVEGVYQLRRGYGETIEEIEESRDELLRIATDFDLPNAPHQVKTGAFYYWFDSDLSRSLKLKTVAPLGYAVQIEDLDAERVDAWNKTYQTLRAAGWNIR